MGIKRLNRFLIENCSKTAIHKIDLSRLSNKTVAIDTSIYLYKFINDNALIENMYLFISILKKYNIQPIFVFDGKPPPEKRELIQQRREDKYHAKQKYLACLHLLDKEEMIEKRDELLHEMNVLKKKIVKVKEEDTIKVKELMDSYGVVYYDAPGEADVLCSYLVNINKAWACISDDMDMFLYGCKRVIRHVSLLHQTAVFYDTECILKDLKLNETIFREIMVLSGTDYNIHSDTTLNDTLVMYNKYKTAKQNEIANEDISFYEWLSKYTTYIKNMKKLGEINELFMLDRYSFLDQCHLQEPSKKYIRVKQLKNLLLKYGFIFV